MLNNLLKSASNPLSRFWGVLFILAALGAGAASLKLYINKINYERERAVTTAKSLSDNLGELIRINNQNVEAFEKLVEARKRDTEVMLHLSSQMAGLTHSYKQQTQAIKQLEKANEKVADYLNTRVPDDLAGVLNRPREADGDRGPNGIIDAASPALPAVK